MEEASIELIDSLVLLQSGRPLTPAPVAAKKAESGPEKVS